MGLYLSFSIALLLFIPTIWIHYNATAWVYAPVYGAVVLAGVCGQGKGGAVFVVLDGDDGLPGDAQGGGQVLLGPSRL